MSLKPGRISKEVVEFMGLDKIKCEVCGEHATSIITIFPNHEGRCRLHAEDELWKLKSKHVMQNVKWSSFVPYYECKTCYKRMKTKNGMIKHINKCNERSEGNVK